MFTPLPMNLEAAQTLLRQFICIEQVPADQIPTSEAIRSAVCQVRDRSDYQIFGICADTASQAIATLHHYLAALGYSARPQPDAIAGSVYLKFNPKTDRCHLDIYTGTHRGVLVSCQSADDEDVNETYGHLPLNLFDGT
ncbi:DUF1824 family protein [Phormidium sp. CLA17]|uniref:DUF1824 family protein n=1 Tax=Leptolyngbya sp. Cla-17 TaxID=2803751 RepID=UPI001492DAC8|nr:DUF1824 family protein [Leptolyngbya sp. Cla-17]MBM0741907.1 DUF1824 family protein [Leptolyngbya sp. Cla-17]